MQRESLLQSQVFFDGSYRRYADVQLGLLTHALHYGTGILEGIRAYWNAAAGELRLLEAATHFARMKASSAIMGLPFPYEVDELVDISVELLRRNDFREDVYLRPILFVSDEALVCHMTGLRTSFALSAVPFGDYVPLDRGVRCIVSTWRRVPDIVLPARAKVSGSYVCSALAKSEALAAGFDEAITLGVGGKVSEGSAENVFIRRGGVFATTPVTADILEGVTRRLVMTLIREQLELPVVEREIDRSELYCSDEVLLCGTGAQVAGVIEVDRRPVGSGVVGEYTRRLQRLYFSAARGEIEEYRGWSVPVYGGVVAGPRIA